jgi:proteasome lid subunit RPN8/RPN11
VSVVSATDYFVELQLEKLGPLGRLAVKKLATRSLDHELAIRQRRMDELQAARVTDGPTPEWVRRVRDGDAPTPRSSSTTSADAAPNVDFRPDREAHFGAYQLMLSIEAREAIRRELSAAAPLQVETGGFLFAHQRRVFFADICHASGPAPNSRHSRTSVMTGEVADVRAEFGEFTQRANLKHIGCWHSHPWGNGEPSRADMKVWRQRLEKSGGDQYLGVIATPEDGHGSSMFPRLHAWLIRRDSLKPGNYLCEAARIREP